MRHKAVFKIKLAFNPSAEELNAFFVNWGLLIAAQQ